MTDYLMEDSREARRLADKVNPQRWVRRYLLPLDLKSQKILDVGCGPAVIAAEIGRQFGSAEVMGIDASPNRVNEAQSNISHIPNVSVQIGDALSLPFENESFDFVLCRFLMEYLPDKELAVREMKRVLKPGGRLFLQDLDGQLIWHYPIDQSLQHSVERVLHLLGKSGFDPMVGRKLFYFCRSAGFDRVDVGIEPYHLIAGPIDAENRALWKTKLEIATKNLGEIPELRENVAAISQKFLEYLDRCDTFTYSVLVSVIASKQQ